MFKKLSYSMAVFCMVCSSMLSSLNAECPCKKCPPKKTVINQAVVVDSEYQELAN